MALFRCGSVDHKIAVKPIKAIYMQVHGYGTGSPPTVEDWSPLRTIYNSENMPSYPVILRTSSATPGNVRDVLDNFTKIVYADDTSEEYGDFVGSRSITANEDAKYESFVNRPGVDENGNELEPVDVTIPFSKVIKKESAN